MIFSDGTVVEKDFSEIVWKDAVQDIKAFEEEQCGNIRDLLSVDFDDVSDDKRSLQVFADFARHALGSKIQLRTFPASLGKMSSQGHVSWLMSVGPNVLKIAVDLELLERRTESSRLGFRLARIFLHEIAHLKYHYSYCFPKPTTYAASCRPDHEAVAWLYSAIVTGFALGQFAYDVKKAGVDSTWSLV